MYKQRIVLFFSIIICIFTVFFLLMIYFYKHPLYTPAAYWIKEDIIRREQYNSTIITPKIIIASGSNSIHGICTPLLNEKTQIKILNLGLVANLPIEFYFALIKKYANPNDIVLLPLEYTYYIHSKLNPKFFDKFQINNLSTWGTEYLNEFTVIQLFEIICKTIATYPQRFIKFSFKLPIRSYEEMMINKNSILSKSRLSFNYWGDFLADMNSQLPSDMTETYFSINQLQNYRFRKLENFSNFLAKKNIKLLLTYPVSIQNPDFDLTKKEHLNKIKTLNEKFEKYKLNYIGIPELSNFELQYSYDTIYHLNAEGAILRSLYLSDTINCYLANKKQEIPDIEKYKNEKKKEAKKILEEYRKLGYVSK